MIMINGKKIELRALEPSDVDLLYQWENDTSIWHLSTTITPLSRFNLEQFVLNSREDIYTTKQLRLMIDLREPEGNIKTIGSIDLFEFEPTHQRAGVGILIHKDYRGKGYAGEALDTLIHYAFNTLQLHQLFCNVSPENPESLQLFLSRKFQTVGLKKDWNRIQNQWQDEYLLQLIKQ
jgi:diamine N-acetyltransferase